MTNCISRRRLKLLGFAVLLVALAVTATGCGSKDVNSASDTTACVYDGSRNGGQRLLFQLQPGSHRTTDSEDEVVQIPTSNRFYMAAEDRGIADPGAPSHYEGTARGGVKILIQGQARFRFNPARSCQWYAQHGRRNTPLAFNARGCADCGWARWLNENFGVTMQQIVPAVTNNYDWAALVYDYPANADDTGTVPKGSKPGKPVQDLYSAALGRAFTAKLNANLGSGGPYFCGISTDTCGDIQFQVLKVTTEDQTLMQERQKVEALRQQQQNGQAEARIQTQNEDITLKSEKAQQRILREKLTTAQLQAQVDEAKCLVLAKAGLDCEGHRPGANVTVNQGK